MFEELLFIIAGGTVFICVLFCIHYIIVVPSRKMRLQEFLDNESYKDAEIFLLSTIKKEPNNVNLIFELAELYWKTNRIYDAITQYEILLTKKIPNNMSNTINYRLACWYKDEGQLGLAQEKLETLLETDPNNYTYLALLADIYYSYKNYSEAGQLYKKSLSTDKKNAHCWKQLGHSYFHRGLYIDAYKAYSYAINLDANDPLIWFQIAESCFFNEDFDKALSFYIKTEQFAESYYSFKSTIKVAQIYKVKRLHSNYVQYLEKARLVIQEKEYLPFEKVDILDVYYQLGECYLQDQHIDLALDQWEKILQIDPKYKDTNEKFNSHCSARVFDFFKDILTANGEVLTDILVEFLKNLGFTIDSIQHHGAEFVDFYVSESSSKWRNSKRRKEIVSFWCINDPIPLDIGIKLSARTQNTDISQIHLISAGPILSELRQVLSRKAINVYDQSNLQEFIDARKKNNNK